MAETWGDVYRQHLRKGEDHGSAAYAADQWEKRRAQSEEMEINRIKEREILKRHGIL